MRSLQNGINDETQTKQTQKYLDAEPSKKSAYDQAVNAAKAILTKLVVKMLTKQQLNKHYKM